MSASTSSSPHDISIPAEYRYIAFFELLADAILQHREATRTTEPFMMNRFARASILASALSVECVANCLLIALDTSQKLSDELDRMSPLSKIEVYLKLKSKPALDRGNVKVARIADLISARNDFVHPKVKGIPATMSMPRDAGKDWMFPFTIDGAHHKQLPIPKVPLFWSAENSLVTLKAVEDFFRYLFCMLLKAEREEMHNVLISRIEAGNVHIPAVYDEIRSIIQSVRDIGVDFSYFGLFPEVATDKGAHKI